MDAFLGNMVANRHCELRFESDRDDHYVTLICGCRARHTFKVGLHLAAGRDYAIYLVKEIERAFTCC
jgi:hypothetical protein